MRNFKLFITSFCLAAPLMMGITANAAPIEKEQVCKETSIITNAKKVQLELMMGDTTPYAFIGLSTADDYVNIRKSPKADGEIVGKLYKGGAVLLEEMQGEWAKVVSGDVKGYISSKYLVVGEGIKDMLDDYALTYARVNTMTLRVREKKSEDSSVLGLVSEDESYRVLGHSGDWIKIDFNGKKGYVSKKYVSIYHEFENAVSIEEERQNQEAEEKARQEEMNKTKPSTTNMPTVSRPTATKSPTKTQSSNNSTTNSVTNNTVSGTGSSLVSYAKQFVGNPYVWGGTSLTNGADCSGFVQSVFRNFGYSLPRTSRQQAKVGTSVSASNLQAGDLIFYASGGTVNHVAIYIGGGKIVHASNPKDGIKISIYNYRSPYAIKRVLK